MKPASTTHNDQALNQARKLNYEFKQPIYCAIDENGSIYDLAIGSPVFSMNYIYDERGKDQIKADREQAVKEAHNLTFTREGKTHSEFTFTLNGEQYEGVLSRNKGSVNSYYRIPVIGIKAETFSGLIKKI